MASQKRPVPSVSRHIDVRQIRFGYDGMTSDFQLHFRLRIKPTWNVAPPEEHEIARRARSPQMKKAGPNDGPAFANRANVAR